jgi:hypothetical protein
VTNTRNAFFLGDKQPMAKIASIGLFKSGTRSLISAFRRLGYTTSEDTYNHARLGLWCSGYPALDFQEVQDEPCFAFWKLLADAHSDLRFVMTVRPFEDWYRSIQRNMARPDDIKVVPKIGGAPTTTIKPRRGKSEGRIFLERVLAKHNQPTTSTVEFLLGVLGGGLDASRVTLERVYEYHYESVREYFAWDPWRFLEWDLCGDPRWEVLCDWLGEPVPNEPFPWINKTPV